MQKLNVWIDLPDGKEEYVGEFEGYIGEIATATLMLYPQAVGLLISPAKDE